MTAFEQHLGREMKPTECIEERDWYCKRHLSKETLKWREETTKNNKPKPEQLKLWI